MAKNNEPLTESYFYILLCLYQGPNHGYGIMQQTAELTRQRVKIGAGTMYGAFSSLIKKGYIRDYEGEDNAEKDRRRLYVLTDVGKKILDREIQRLKELVANADTIRGKEI